MSDVLKFIDLFAGIGGFHIAAENASLGNKKMECVLVSEIDQKAKEAYSRNFNWDIESIKDIKDINEAEINDFDVLFAGFPCQAFSNAGNKLGFNDLTKGTLFFEIERILKNKNPKYFILENVKHLVKHDNGNTWKVIQESIKKLGYITTEKPLIISALEVGIPQNRERVYILGVKKELLKNKNIHSIAVPQNIFQKYTEEEYKKVIFENILEENVNEKFYLNEKNKKDKHILEALNAWNHFIKNVKFPDNKTLPVIWLDVFKIIDEEERENSVKNFVDWRKKYYKDMWALFDNNRDFIESWEKNFKTHKWAKRERKFEWQAGNGCAPDIKKTFIQLRQSGIRCKRMNSFPTLVAMVQTPIIFDENRDQWRYITPKEAGRLQSFEFSNKNKQFKSYSELFPETDRIGDQTSYKQFGNAVNTKVVQKLIEYLINNY